MRHVFRLMFIFPVFVMIFLSGQNQKIAIVKGVRHG